MARWSYEVFDFSGSTDKLKERLNLLGTDGWELVNFTPQTAAAEAGSMRLVLKREPKLSGGR
ncbi:MAG: DUF4177 domain-containing protein [Chloroflexi bacterium]|nr:DUF4177 domain-containing protein [Chloroflexota bacterium]